MCKEYKSIFRLVNQVMPYLIQVEQSNGNSGCLCRMERSGMMESVKELQGNGRGGKKVSQSQDTHLRGWAVEWMDSVKPGFTAAGC